jgi:hypothetical protein
VHCQTVYRYQTELFDPSLGEGPMRADESSQLSQRVTALSSFEDPSWDISLLSSSQGRSPANVFLWSGENDQHCLVRVQKHRELVVRCMGGTHVGHKAACCRDVQQAWNAENPRNLAGLFAKPVPFAPSVDTTSQKFLLLSEGEGWPFDEPGSELNNVMTKEWMDRDPYREYLLFVSEGQCPNSPSIDDGYEWCH